MNRRAYIAIALASGVCRLYAQDRGFIQIPESRKLALVIGNSEYLKAPLKNPVNDAAAMETTLKTLGFNVTTVRNADLRRMRTAIDEFVAKLGPGSIGFFYFAGHGVQVNSVNYLVPVDFSATSEDDIPYEAYPASRVQVKLEGSGARLRVLVLDACRNNPFRFKRDASEGLAAMSINAEGTLIAFATGDNNTAAENPGETNGLYTKFLIPALLSPGLNLRDAFQKAKEDVYRVSQRQQNPSIYENIVGQYALLPSASPIREPRLDAAVETWALIKDSANAGDFEAFALAYPNSDLTPGARLRAAQLRRLAGPAPVLPLLPCTTALRSERAGKAIEVTFRNQSTFTVKTVWIEADGQKRDYNTLVPGASVAQGTWEKHTWMITDTAGGCLGYVRVGDTNAEVVFAGTKSPPSRPLAGGLPPPPLPPDGKVPAVVDPFLPARILAFDAEPASILRGQSATLRWSVADASEIAIDQDIGSLVSNGQRQIFPATTTTYTLSARSPGGNDTRTVAVTVTNPEPPPSLPHPPPSPGATKVNPKDGLTYAWIPPGTFQMGCSPGDSQCADDEKPVHPVTITKGFWMGQTEVTQEAYQRVIRANPSNSKGNKLPVEEVNWSEARAYCEAVGMRLPTEAEWEYAARGGTTTSRYEDVDSVAWYSGNSGGRTHEAGQKQRNGFGLRDMLGNAQEWTADWYGSYSERATSDPQGPSSGQYRVRRGASFGASAWNVRASDRGWLEPFYRNDIVGLRCAG